MQQWSVRVVAQYDEVDGARATAAFETLEKWHPSGQWVLDPVARTWAARLEKEANSAVLAIEFAMAHIDAVLAASRLPRRAVVEVAVSRTDVREQVGSTHQPLTDAASAVIGVPVEHALVDLVGAGEVLALLGISKQRLYQLRAANRFPVPLTELVSGPIWQRSVIESYAANRRPPGRPRKPA